MDEDEERAWLRIRVLRRDAYRCKARLAQHAPFCGAFACLVGVDPFSGEVVTLCTDHAPR